MLLDGASQSVDVYRFRFIGRHDAHCRLETLLHECFEELVVHRRRRRRRILRIEREHDDPLATLRQKAVGYAFDGGLAITHRPVHDHIGIFGKRLCKLLALRAGIGP